MFFFFFNFLKIIQFPDWLRCCQLIICFRKLNCNLVAVCLAPAHWLQFCAVKVQLQQKGWFYLSVQIVLMDGRSHTCLATPTELRRGARSVNEDSLLGYVKPLWRCNHLEKAWCPWWCHIGWFCECFTANNLLEDIVGAELCVGPLKQTECVFIVVDVAKQQRATTWVGKENKFNNYRNCFNGDCLSRPRQTVTCSQRKVFWVFVFLSETSY